MVLKRSAVGVFMVPLKLAILACCLCVIGLGESAQAGPFDDAMAVYESGNYAEAFKLLLPFANNGYAPAQFTVGAMYSEGQGVPRDIDRAKDWFSRAAAQGYAPAARLIESRHEESGSSEDDKTCKSYGAKRGSQAYVQCRLTLKARKEDALAAQARAEAFAEDQRQLAQRRLDAEQQARNVEATAQRAAADAQTRLLEEDRRRRQGEALLGLSAALLGGGGNGAGVTDQTRGTHTYIMNGRTVTCTTAGTVTNCF